MSTRLIAEDRPVVKAKEGEVEELAIGGPE
jgi:hypothetical protein